MAARATSAALSIADWHTSAAYLGCTERQRKFLDVFIESKDEMRAVVAAYGSKSTEGYRRMLATKTLASAHVVVALDTYFQRSDREKFLRDLKLAIEHSEGVARIHALRLYGKATGFLPTEKPAETEHPVSVGEIVLVNGVKFRVTAIDANGKPTDGEPL